MVRCYQSVLHHNFDHQRDWRKTGVPRLFGLKRGTAEIDAKSPPAVLPDRVALLLWKDCRRAHFWRQCSAPLLFGASLLACTAIWKRLSRDNGGTRPRPIWRPQAELILDWEWLLRCTFLVSPLALAILGAVVARKIFKRQEEQCRRELVVEVRNAYSHDAWPVNEFGAEQEVNKEKLIAGLKRIKDGLQEVGFSKDESVRAVTLLVSRPAAAQNQWSRHLTETGAYFKMTGKKFSTEAALLDSEEEQVIEWTENCDEEKGASSEPWTPVARILVWARLQE